MVRRKLNVIDIVEVLEHWYSDRLISVMASSLGLDTKTIRKYVVKAKEARIVPGSQRIDRSYGLN